MKIFSILRILPFLILIPIPKNGNAQPFHISKSHLDPEEKIEALLGIATDEKTSPEEATEIFRQALAISEKHDLAEKEVEVHKAKAQFYLQQSKYFLGIQAYKEALRILKEKNLREEYWETNQALSQAYQEIGEYGKAIEICFDALEHYKQTQDRRNQAKYKMQIGKIFHLQENPKKALDFYHQGEKILKERDDTITIIYSQIQSLKGLSYIFLSEFEKAIASFNYSEKINQLLKEEDLTISNLGQLGMAYGSLNQFEESESYFKEAIKISYEKNDSLSAAINQGDLAYLYWIMSEKTKDPTQRNNYLDLALLNTEKAIKVFRTSKNLKGIQALYKQLSFLYESKNQIDLAYENYKNSIKFKDCVLNSRNMQEIARLHLSHEFKKTQDSLRLVNEKELAIRDANIKTKEKEKWLFLVIIVSLLIITMMILIQSKSRKRKNTELHLLNDELHKANQIKTRFFSILNHDLRRPISNVINFLYLRKNAEAIPLDSTSLEELEQHIMESAEHLLSTMEEMLLWSKSQMENFKPEFKKVEISLIFEDIKMFYHQEKVSFRFENPENLSLITDENYLKTITRNLTSNCISALSDTVSPLITWSAKKERGNIFLSIKDNGPGADPEQFQALFDENQTLGVKSGLGLHLVRDMAKAIGCKVRVVHSSSEQGTKIELEFHDLNLN